MKNIYFISESIPYNGYGSFVIFYRHLIRLKRNGYVVHLIVPDYEEFETSEYFNDIVTQFNIIRVPFNKWWYPPYRCNNRILRYIRFSLIYQVIKYKILENPPNFIVTYFYGNFLNGFSVFLKKIYKCNIGIFLHDDKYLLNTDYNEKLVKFDQFICVNSSVIWSVSDRLKIPNCKGNYITLPPIPEGSNTSTWIKKDNSPKKFTIGFSGSIYESYFPVFQLLAKVLISLDGELHIIAKDIERTAKHLTTFKNVKFISAFEYNHNASRYLKDNCTALFCGYPDAINEMPWLKSCFPSKFVEYTHLQLPIILSGPNDTSLTDWVMANNWALFLENLDEHTLTEMLVKLKNPDFWEKTALQSKYVAENEFNADKIQLLFETSLMENLK